MFSRKFKREEGKEGRCGRGQPNFKEMPNRKIFLSAPVKFLYIYLYKDTEEPLIDKD